ncbi:MAG: hypothetical protein V4722_04190 [Bacteroidota bacterium]
MNHTKILLLAVTISSATFVFSQKNVISILNDRFYMRFPDSAKNMSRSTNIMSAGPNATQETRVVYDEGDKRMVFFAQELNIKGVPNLETALKKESDKDYPLTVRKIFDKDSVQVILMTPLKIEINEEAIFINSLIIKNADNTLSKLSVFLNPKAYASKKDFEKIAAMAFASFTKGVRRIDLSARTVSFNPMETKTIFLLKLPKDYTVTRDESHDFEVYKIKKVEAYGLSTRGDLIIYFGYHPSLFEHVLKLEKFKTADTEHEFMFHKLKWFNYNDKSRALVVREGLFVDDDISKDLQIHIGMISDSQGRIDEMTSIVKDILFKYDK